MDETWWVDPSQLDDDQKQVLTVSPDVSLLIKGPPGSGKTNILMLRANYLRPVGARQHFLTFTRALAEHLRSGPNVGRADQIQKEEISTFMSWARGIIRQNGGELAKETGIFEDDRRNAVEMLTNIVNTQEIGELYDVILVDEVQDFWESELLIVKRLAHHVNYAGDSRQRIFKHREGLITAERLADRTVELTIHYRIGEKICNYADQILPPKTSQEALLDGCNYQERVRPSSLDVVKCDDEDQMIVRCIEKIKEQVRYITNEPIGVVSASNEILDRFMEVIESDMTLAGIVIRQKSNEYRAYNENSRIRVMTVHSAKGSEFRAVHLLDGNAFKSFNRELAFTAVTRAKTEVSIYHTAPLAGHMIPASGLLTDDLSTLF